MNDKQLPSVDAEIVAAQELSLDEERDRYHLERKVERAFYEAGKALQELRNRRLYRSTHGTFEEYCRDRFGHSRQKSNYLIAAAGVYDNLTTNGCQNPPIDDLTTNSSQILPTNERQVRSLTQLEPEQQREVWQQAVETAGGKVPSGRIVKNIVQQIMERTKVPNPYRVGEVCQFIPKDNPELRGKGNCWCIVTEVKDFSCVVTAWDRNYTVAVQHLKSRNYSDFECEEMKGVCDRLIRLYSPDMEAAALVVLKSLGELKRSYLTELEEKLLGVLEEYGR
ncbi:hypothetical protein [Rivularia sp. UHCC 0363]|uniref:hypothetical protein n=1 Tax=Rivularia sp. UHCC 0363 TaxID=3110244 RepID=UPI002B1F41CA|nr:hypothetical protein [Rivularia sp. UHCC 0363]MEA5595697.1 hypothetical protein [Rivularia sp. UHCC 0363]